MSVRYIVYCCELDNMHPLWPGEIVFRILDTKNNRRLFSCYTNPIRAQEVADEKNAS